jgi:ParB/RepB/Spo0J family partition protein
MSTQTQMTEIPTAKIVAIEGRNPRGEIDTTGEDFAKLKASIEARGVETPIKVGPADEDGIHPIIFGYTRHAAACELGLESIPAIVDAELDEKGRFLAAITENRARSAMTPMAEARALKTLREEFGMKQAEAAAAMSMSERSARNREAMLGLPDRVQDLIDDGKLPLEAANHLSELAKAIRPDVALAIAQAAENLDELADRNKVFIALGDLAHKVGLQEISDFDDGPQIPVAKLGLTPDQRAELRKLHEALPSPNFGSKPGFSFPDELRKKAEQIGGGQKAIFHGKFKRWGQTCHVHYIVDPAVTFELAKLQIPKIEREVREMNARTGTPMPRSFDSAEAKKQLAAAQKKAERDRKRADKENAVLGEKLSAIANPKATDVDVVRLVCTMALGLEEELADVVQGGLGLLVPDVYSCNPTVDGDDEAVAAERFPDQIVLQELANAKTAGECLKVVVRTIIAYRLGQAPGGGVSSLWRYAGEVNDSPLDVAEMVDNVAEALELIPSGARSAVKDHRAKRARERQAAEERRAKAEQIRAEEDAEVGTRAEAALEIIRTTPAIAAAEIADQLGIKPNYLYRILGDLEKEGKISKNGRTYTVVEEAVAA